MARILVADDNPLVHRIAVQVLTAEGHEVEGVMTGAVLIERISEMRPDLLLLDTALPDASVSETLDAILSTRDLQGIQITLLAGPLEDLEAAEVPPGIHTILQKPLDAATLLNLVRDIPPTDNHEHSPTQRILHTLVSQALGRSEPDVSRETIRAQVDEAVTAAVPAIVDRITDRVVERLRLT